MKVQNALRGALHQKGHDEQSLPRYSYAKEGSTSYGGSYFAFPLKYALLDSRYPKGGHRKISFVTRTPSNGRLSPGVTILDFYFVWSMVF
jgi:hypothetical protein